MNFEHLSHKISKNYTHLNNNRLTILLNYVKLKKQKFKTNILSFEIKTFYWSNFILYETLEIRHIQQNGLNENSSSLKQKWSIYNILLLFILLIVVFIFAYNQFNFFYYENLLDSSSFNIKNDLIIEYSFNFCLQNSLQSFNNFYHLNAWFSNLLIDLCDYYKILK